MIEKDIEIVKQDLNNWKKEFGTEGSVAINIKSLENVLKEFQGLREFSAETVKRNAELQEELDTYKKIAEKLAEEIILADKFIEDNCCSTGIYAKVTVEEVIKTFRKEVEKDE